MISERELIDYIRTRLPAAPPWLLVPGGDDAAVVAPARGALDVLTTDTLVEGVHFDPAFSRPADVGAKALAVNLSDLAAMGAEPRAALLSLSIPASWDSQSVLTLVDSVVASAVKYRVAIAGGNVTSSPGPLVVTMTLTGTVRPRRALLRSGARPGDGVYVSAAIGAAAAGLGMLREARPLASEAERQCVDRYRSPQPRVRLGLMLGRNRAATACIDLSDGLAEAARQIAEASGTGIVLEADAIPVHPAARDYFVERGLDPVTAALAGGDDYELLFTASPKRRGPLAAVVRLTSGLAITRIGAVTSDGSAVLRRDGGDEPLPGGYRHF